MIESITIADYASYGDEPVVLDELGRRNYFFGSNGCGKSSIGNVIANPAVSTGCNVTWHSPQPVETWVYNRDFVRENFDSSDELKGVFTLGADSKETKARIEILNADLAKGQNALGQQKEAATGIDAQLAKLDLRFTEACWAQKVKHDDVFKDAFARFRRDKSKFKEQVLKQRTVFLQPSDSTGLYALLDLQKRAEIVFGAEPEEQPSIPALDYSELTELESESLLGTRILGKEDVDLAALITRLGNSDWVGAGRSYLASSKGLCPFCQRTLPADLEQELSSYFDETFIQQTAAYRTFVSKYETAATAVQIGIQAILSAPGQFVDVDNLSLKKAALDAEISTNIERLATKAKEPSQLATLVPLASILDEIRDHIAEANRQIGEYNRKVANLHSERSTLSAEVWKFLVYQELKRDLGDYDSETKMLETTKHKLQDRIDETTLEISNMRDEISTLEKQTTTIQPTLNGINRLLKNLGFHGFSLTVADDERSYRLVREDGTAVEDTLSEGERTFITFLYFYHLLRGSQSESGTTSEMVVVFDDPVSSLDSEILFIVSTLVRRICNEAGEGGGRIKQAFVLTHNVYFHKEVTFAHDEMKGRETFWLVRKPQTVSIVERFSTNPVKSSYELLWHEIGRQDRTAGTVQNAMRRILEHYFKHLGGILLDQLIEKFVDEGDHIVCRSLLSWVNDGSHSAQDDIFICTDAGVDRYLKVFADIFVHSDHVNHYLMMCDDGMKSLVQQSQAVQKDPA